MMRQLHAVTTKIAPTELRKRSKIKIKEETWQYDTGKMYNFEIGFDILYIFLKAQVCS